MAGGYRDIQQTACGSGNFQGLVKTPLRLPRAMQWHGQKQARHGTGTGSNVTRKQGAQQPVTETIVREKPKIGRNERVTIKNVISGENKTVKFKQAEPLIAKGEWVLVGD